MLYKICSRCGKIHNHGQKCYANSKNYNKIDPEIRKFRNSTLWSNKSIEIRQLDHYLCQVCLSENIFNYKSLSVHHITPLKEDMSKSLDNDNLITLCETHHKQAEEGKITKEKLYNLIKERF